MDVWDRVMAVNVTGTLRLTQAVLPAMSEGGAVVNVTSGAAGRATWGAYGVSKLALDGVTAMLREELAPRGIRCVGVNPGGTRTEMRAAAYPDEDPATLPHPSSRIAPFIAVLAGDDPGPHVEAAQWTGA
jgi:NAD(P)-dependent dehydrogenase (short-subunit alcohol dehydrogenase family)